MLLGATSAPGNIWLKSGSKVAGRILIPVVVEEALSHLC